MTKTVVTLTQFCLDNSVGKTFAYAEIGAGRLQASKAGRKTVITAEAAAAWRASLPKIIPRQSSAAGASKGTAKLKSELPA